MPCTSCAISQLGGWGLPYATVAKKKTTPRKAPKKTKKTVKKTVKKAPKRK
jgi:hypothetical protein